MSLSPAGFLTLSGFLTLLLVLAKIVGPEPVYVEVGPVF